MLIKQTSNSNGARSRVNILAAVVMTAGLAFSAIPANAYIPKSSKVEIKINAVDLETDRGVERVYAYMTSQAERSCESSSRTNIAVRQYEEACTASLLTSFVDDVNNDRLTAYHERQIAS